MNAEELVREQERLGRATPPPWTPTGRDLVGACFVCFARGGSGPGHAGDPAWAAAATGGAGALVYGEAGSPYEPGLLALREGALLQAAVEALPRPPDVLLVDGTGRDHPRRAGLALHLGAVLDLPTVGVTHRPLAARGEWPPDERGARSPLLLDGEPVGYWLRTRAGRRPLAVHAAWRTDPDTAVEVAIRSVTGTRTPEPLREGSPPRTHRARGRGGLSGDGTAATILVREVQMAELPTGTVTFLFTDVEESTAVVRKLGPDYADALRRNRDVLRAAFADHGGHEVDTQGDSFFVAFTRARDAALAAVDAQRVLEADERPDGHQLHVRMGLHTAEPHRWEEGYVGVGVHRAARICAVGHGGQVLLSRSTAGLIDDEDLPGVALRDLGAHRLKGLDRPERIFQLLVDGLPSEFPPLKTMEGAGLATETLVVLFGDLGAATPTRDTDAAEFRQLIAAYHRSVESVVTEHGGLLMASFGDAVGAVFRSARAALAAARGLHRRLAEQEWPGRTEVRMAVGLAAGEAVATAFGYFGTAVNASMALCSLAKPGQTLVAETVRVLLDRDDFDRLQLSSAGHRIGRNTPEFDVYEVVAD